MHWNFHGLLRLHGRLGWSPHDGLSWAVQGLACMAVAWILAQSVWWLATPGGTVLPAKASSTLLEQSHRVTARHFFDVEAAQQPASDDGENAPPAALIPAGDCWARM